MRLARAGHDLRVFSRRRERHRELLVLPTAQVVEADVHDPAALKREFHGLDAVVNLVGILNEKGRDGSGFEKAHAELPAKVVQACRQAGVARLLHMSALHAAPDCAELLPAQQGARRADRARCRGPGTARDQLPSVGDLRPGRQLHQPVREAVAAGAARAPARLRTRAHAAGVRRRRGQRVRGRARSPRKLRPALRPVRSAGPIPLRRSWAIWPGCWASSAVSFRSATACRACRRRCLQFVPGKPFTPDNYRSLQVASTCDRPFPAVFGVTPARFEDVVPTYLGAVVLSRHAAQFNSVNTFADR
ncbi:MAG: NAD(P)H-binding protein [Chromatiales bacterium]|nr:NAD(P)H-binding protein [Chromatiales bacterium]